MATTNKRKGSTESGAAKVAGAADDYAIETIADANANGSTSESVAGTGAATTATTEDTSGSAAVAGADSADGDAVEADATADAKPTITVTSELAATPEGATAANTVSEEEYNAIKAKYEELQAALAIKNGANSSVSNNVVDMSNAVAIREVVQMTTGERFVEYSNGYYKRVGITPPATLSKFNETGDANFTF